MDAQPVPPPSESADPVNPYLHACSRLFKQGLSLLLRLCPSFAMLLLSPILLELQMPECTNSD